MFSYIIHKAKCNLQISKHKIISLAVVFFLFFVIWTKKENKWKTENVLVLLGMIFPKWLLCTTKFLTMFCEWEWWQSSGKRTGDQCVEYRKMRVRKRQGEVIINHHKLHEGALYKSINLWIISMRQQLSPTTSNKHEVAGCTKSLERKRCGERQKDNETFSEWRKDVYYVVLCVTMSKG